MTLGKQKQDGMKEINKQPPKETYKERNGTTRVGDTLRWLVSQGKNIAPEILDIAGSVTNIEGLENLADKIRGSSELTDFDKKILLEKIELDKIEMQEISKRWASDMESDSWASKNIRPYLTAGTIIFLFILILLDSSIGNFIVKEYWVDLIGSLAITMVVAYFGSRGVEKVKKVAGKFRL